MRKIVQFCLIIMLFPVMGISQWEVVDTGVSTRLIDISFYDNNHGWAVGDSGTVIRTTDGGKTWIKQETPVTSSLRRIECTDANTMQAIGYKTFLATRDGGQNWTHYYFADSLSLGGFSFLNADTGWVASGPEMAIPHLFYTTDGGESWESRTIRNDSLDGFHYAYKDIKFIDNNTGWVWGRSHAFFFIWKTENAGNSWELLQGYMVTNAMYPGSRLTAVTQDTIWTYAYTVGSSFDGGITWQFRNISGFEDMYYFEMALLSGSSGFGVDYDRLEYFDLNLGIKKTIYTPPDKNIVRLSITDDKTIWLLNSDRQIIKGKHTVTSIESPEIIPESFYLAQNYPNPFNPTTSISFSLTQFSKVNLTIYSVTGKKVATLVNETRSPGAHAAVWDGTNSSGQPVSSGLYFYRLTTGNYSETKKMLLVK